MPSLLDHALRAYCRSRGPGAGRLLNTLRPYGAVSPENGAFESRLGPLRYWGNLSEHIDRAIFYFGSYSPAELDFLTFAAAKARREGALNFFDIGANVGQHSLWMARHADRMIAFEPSARAARQFRGNLELNGIDNVELHEVALGEDDYTAQLGSGFKHNSGSRSLTWSLDETANEAVEVRAAGRFFELNALPRMDLLKIDVEGYEAHVLGALTDRLHADRPVILMELIGSPEKKSGFESEAALRASLYPDHELFSLTGQDRWRLAPFSWDSEEIVCAPQELAEALARR